MTQATLDIGILQTLLETSEGHLEDHREIMSKKDVNKEEKAISMAKK